jgi:hypothetical protein
LSFRHFCAMPEWLREKTAKKQPTDAEGKLLAHRFESRF